MTTQKEDKLLILLVSDIHESIESINKLAAYCQANSINPDYIFCLGDILDITQDSQEDQALYEEKLPILKNILLSLEKICPKLIYLPGNHDPMNLFKVENSPKITENSINLHLKSHMIKDDLLLVGIGGATCSIYSENELYHTYKNLNTKNIEWKGYPYIDDKNSPNYEKSDEMYKKDLEKIGKLIENYSGNALVLTHAGPFTSSTSNQFEGRIIYGGSPALNEFLLKYEDKIIGNVHGHTHEAEGQSKIHFTKIYNPGALFLNKFGFLNLVKNKESNYKWKIEKYQQVYS